MIGTATIEAACDLVTDGTHYTPRDVGKGIPFLTVKDVADESLDFISCSFITEDDYETAKAGNSAPQRGDVLFSKDGTVGKVHVVETDQPFAVLSSLAILRPKKDAVDAKFLGYVLRSPRVLDDALKRKTGSAIRRVILSDLKKVRIPLPPLPGQQRIAEILDKADALRAKRRAAIAKLDTLTQSIFLDMFGDPATNPKGWPTSTLEELFEIARGGSPRPIDDYITESPDGVNWIMIGDAPEGAKYITATKKKIKPEGVKRSRSVRPGDFLLTNSMSFGRPYIMRTSGCIHDGWLVLSPRKGNPVPGYFYSLLSSRALHTEFSRRALGATVKNLNIGLVRSVLVPVPPEEKQREYAVHVSAIEAAAVPFERSLERFESLFASLQQRAFRGAL